MIMFFDFQECDRRTFVKNWLFWNVLPIFFAVIVGLFCSLSIILLKVIGIFFTILSGIILGSFVAIGLINFIFCVAVNRFKTLGFSGYWCLLYLTPIHFFVTIFLLAYENKHKKCLYCSCCSQQA